MNIGGRSATAVASVALTLIGMVLLVFTVSYLNGVLSGKDFGEVLLFKRQGALIAVLVSLGLSQALIGLCSGRNSKIYKKTILCTFLFVWVFVSVFYWGFYLIFSSVSFLVGGGVIDSLIGVWAFYLYISGLMFSGMVCSALLSGLQVVLSSCFSILCGSLFLLFPAFAFLKSEPIILSYSVMVFFFSFFCFILILAKEFRGAWGAWGEKKYIVRYSFWRGMVSFLDLAAFSLVPWLISSDLELSGHFSAAYIFVRAATSAIGPLSQLIAVRVMKFGKNSDIKYQSKVSAVVFFLFSLGVGVYYCIPDSVYGFLFSNNRRDIISVADGMVFFLPFVAVFYFLRPAYDYRYRFPPSIVFYAISCASMVFIVLFFGEGRRVALIAAEVGLFVLSIGGVCFYFLLRSFLGGAENERVRME